MSYERVLEAMVEHDLDWNEIDQIHLSPETYADFEERASDKVTANHQTSEAPAVRETAGQEKIIYVGMNGIEVTIEI